MAIFKGAGVAIVTPMYEDGKVNYDKLEELLEYQIANSTDAIDYRNMLVTSFAAGGSYTAVVLKKAD